MSQDRSERKGSQIVHVRENSDSDLDALFSIGLNPTPDSNKSIPLRMRNLPASFFQPPEPHHTAKEGSTDSTGFAPSNSSTPNFSINNSINHTRVRSSPASLSQGQTLSTAPPPPCSQHVRQHSYDLAEEPLPPGWSIGVTVVGQRYFLNHETQTTTWVDPRKTQSTTNLHNPQQQQQQQQQLPAPPGHPLQQATQQTSPPNQPTQIVNVDKVALPPGWERAFTPEGEVYYIHHVERTTSWFHPSVPAHLQRPGMRLQQQAQQQQQQQQQQMQVSSPASPANMAQCQQVNTDRHRQLQLLKRERERLKKREEEIARQELMLRTGNIPQHPSNENISDIAISQASEMTSITDPFLSQSGTSDHTRQNSSDSGLGGMGTSYSVSRTPDDFLGNMEEMESQDGGPKIPGPSDFGNMDISNVGSVDGDSNMESEDLVPSLNEAISNDLLKDVETVLQSNKMDNLLTWL